MIKLPDKKLNEVFWGKAIVEKDKEALEFYQKLWAKETCRYCGSSELRIARAFEGEGILYILVCRHCQSKLKISGFREE